MLTGSCLPGLPAGRMGGGDSPGRSSLHCAPPASNVMVQPLATVPSKRRHPDEAGEQGSDVLLPILISIIVPMRNGAEYLDECFESVANQTNIDPKLVELSVYNDASTDESPDMIEKTWRPRLEGIGLRVTVGGEDPAPKGGGCGYAKNRAVRQSSGKYLCFLDCDDIMMPDRLSTQLSVFEALPDYEANNLLLGSCYVRLPINSTPRYTDWHNQMSKQQLLTQQYKECTVAMPTWFMKRSRFDAVGPFIERPAEDLMLFQRHCAMGGAVDRAEKVLMVYRYHATAVTFSVLPATIRRCKVDHLEASLLKGFKGFSLWGGKEARDAFRIMCPENQDKLTCFLDIDPKKIGRPYNCRESPRNIPILHWSEAKDEANRPIIICVKPGLTQNVFEENLSSLGLTEGTDYWFFG